MFRTIYSANVYLLVCFLLLIFINQHSAYTLRRPSEFFPYPIDQETVPAEQFLDYSGDRNVRSNVFGTVPYFNFRRGTFQVMPYKKRTIPLELQKALYAHGIIGRRR